MQAREAEELACALVRVSQVVLEGQVDSPRVYGENEGRVHLGVRRAA